MNTSINYLLEANLGLVFFLMIYWLALKDENNFSFKRLFLLGSIASSLLFPLLHFNAFPAQALIPSMGNAINTYWLPEWSTGHEHTTGRAFIPSTAIQWVSLIYWTVVSIFLLIFLSRLFALLRLISHANKYEWNNCQVAESDLEKSTFSFFHFIYIGQANHLSPQEKQELLRHEAIHARKFHSADRLLITLVTAFFWFNPFLAIYKKQLIKLHEFEADASSLETSDHKTYLELLIKLALPGGEFLLANHFNNAMTIQRIKMMTTMKKKMKFWKFIPLFASALLFFCVVACQEQVITNLKDINKNSAATNDLPPEIQARYDALKNAHPLNEYVVIQLNAEGKAKADQLGFNNAETNTRFPSMNLVTAKDGVVYVIVEKNAETIGLSNAVTGSDSVYTLVEEVPQYPGGIDSLVTFLQRNIHYPETARKAGLQGKVFVSFVVTSKGNIEDATIVKGVGEALDNEAMRVVTSFPDWTPGRNLGKSVSVRYVLPINFSL